MREYLFRGTRKDNGEWVYGFFVCLNGEKHLIYNGYAETDCGEFFPDCIEVFPETVGQYTGLTDKNGERIFEGDVVVWTRDDIRIIGHYAYDCTMYTKGTKFQVIVNEAGFMLARLEDCMLDIPNAGTKVDNYAFWNNSRSLEIIGNIHDNPELIERR